MGQYLSPTWKKFLKREKSAGSYRHDGAGLFHSDWTDKGNRRLLMRHITEQRVKWMSRLRVRCYQRKSVIICLALGGGLTLPFTGFSNVSDSIEDLSNGSFVMLADLERIQRGEGQRSIIRDEYMVCGWSFIAC